MQIGDGARINHDGASRLQGAAGAAGGDPHMAQLLRKLWRDEEGATAVEYGMIVALIAAVIVAVVTTLGTRIQAAFQAVVDAL